MKLTKKAKNWFEEATEMDVVLMIRMGVITENRVMSMYYDEHKRKGKQCKTKSNSRLNAK